jgi:acyl carrier protein
MVRSKDVASDVRRIIKCRLQVDGNDVKPGAALVEDLGADSLGLVEVTLALEEAFEIDIPLEDAEKIRTVRDAIDYVEKRTR